MWLGLQTGRTNMKNKSTAFVIFTVFMVVVLISLMIGLAYYAIVAQEKRVRTSANWPLPEYSREIVKTSPQLEEIWQISPMFAGNSSNAASVYLSADGEYLYLLGSFDSDVAASFYALDILTGATKWQISPDKLAMFTPAPNLVASNESFVYLGYPGSGKIQGDTEIGAAKIVAYDKGTGVEVWSQTIGGARDISSLNVMESYISAVGSTSSHFYLLDAQNGGIIEKREEITKNGREAHPIFIDDNIEYADTWCEAIQATNLETGQLLWRTPYDFCISHPVIVTEDVLIIMPSGNYGYVLALDKLTGKIIWRYDDSPIVSNITLGKSHDDHLVYFLTFDSKLLALDTNSGDVVGEIQFAPVKTSSSDFYYKPEAVFFRYPFYVTSSNDIVSVFWGDSRQLLVFRYTPNSIND
jgi:outer membrane protein assembly factor BamB